jgi:hypothetical protein
MIAWLMKTFNGIVPRKKSICFHTDLFLCHLHNKRSAQVNDISVAYVWELCIGKAFGIPFPKRIEFCFPEEIDKRGKTCRRGYAVIVVFKMIGMEELDMLHQKGLVQMFKFRMVISNRSSFCLFLSVYSGICRFDGI